MANKVYVYIDHFNGQELPASWEAIGVATTLASSLGGGVSAILLGHDIETLAKRAIEFGADQVHLKDDAALKDFRPEPYASMLSGIAAEAEVLLMPTTIRTRELAGLVAVDLDTGVMPDVVAIELSEGAVLATRPIYAGKLMSKVVCQDRRPQILALRTRSFPIPEADSGRSGEVVTVEAAVEEAVTEVTGYGESAAGVSLTDAAVIISAGRGVSNNPQLTPPDDISDEKDQEVWRAQQGFEMIRELAVVLGAAVGASRAAVDAGYVPYVHQVGQTGKVVSPDLYIAAGISGAIQHLAGMRTSKTIVAINKDSEAPIFKLARFGIVGDMHKIVPALTEALKERLGKA
jgi:electron transfer flavoprotein alpha subunit